MFLNLIVLSVFMMNCFIVCRLLMDCLILLVFGFNEYVLDGCIFDVNSLGI